MPKNKKIETEFGIYEVSFEKSPNSLRIKRRFIETGGVVAAEKDKELTEFSQRVSIADSRPIALY